MQGISEGDIVRRIRTENPWWEGDHSIIPAVRAFTRRAYFDLFLPLVRDISVRRAVVLMGPRRVGKTVMVQHAVQALMDEGVTPHAICYFSVDHPLYNGLSLEKLLSFYGVASGTDYKSNQTYIFLDEIQYLRDWEVHLKSIVDSYPTVKAVASGSAAAALRLKSNESGAGRFTDFLLPPLTFYEYLHLLDKTDLTTTKTVAAEHGDRLVFSTENVEGLNQEFLNYLNFGGYPEVIFSPQIREDPVRFIKSDIIDKVLLRDLPSLYGIGDIQELNYLFTTLAFNTAQEVSLGELSKNSGVAKNTIKRYIEYLEAAFLIKVVHRVDHNGRRFLRENFFKAYLTNPSMRAALFSPVRSEDSAMGPLAETSIFSQWFHSLNTTLYYARWRDGEVDIVKLGQKQGVAWAVEVKWSDRFTEHPDELRSLLTFCQANGLKTALITSKTQSLRVVKDGVQMEFLPASLYCYMVGYNLIHGRKTLALASQLQLELPLDPSVTSGGPPTT
jgi:uncharacterized protein